MAVSGGSLEVALVATLTKHYHPVTQIVVRRPEVHQNSLISSSKDSYIIIWTQSRDPDSDEVGPWMVCKRWGLGDPLVKCHYKAVKDLSYIAGQSEEKFVSCSLDKSVILWDLAVGAIEHKFVNAHELGVLSVSISSDGKKITTGSQDRSIKVLDAQSMRRPLIFPNAHDDYVVRVRLNPADDTRYLFSCGGSGIKIWDIRARLGDNLNYDWEQPNNINLKKSIEFGKGGSHMVSGGDSDIINLWKFKHPTDSSQILKSIKVENGSSLSSAKFSPDLSYMAAAKGNKVFIFEMKTYRNVAKVPVDSDSKVEATSLEWSHDGKTLFVGMSNGAIKVFECKVHGRSME